jgi:hypothetical protein
MCKKLWKTSLRALQYQFLFYFQRVRKTCRRLARRCNCIRGVDVAIPQAGAQQQPQQPPEAPAAEPSSSRQRRGKGPVQQPAESEEPEDDVNAYFNESMFNQVPLNLWPSLYEINLVTMFALQIYVPFMQEDIGASQLHDAPPVTQATPPRGRRARRDPVVDSGNVLPTHPGRARKKTKNYTPGTSSRG